MSRQALYLKWRPAVFESVIGQEHVTFTLRNALRGERIGHAYLFHGPRGTGKTSMARILAKAVNCLADDPGVRPCNTCAHCIAVNESRFLDLIEIDAASHTSVDDVRELRDRIAFAPNEGRYKVYIIDEVHRFSGSAFDALLKTLEEPPTHAIFVLATTEIQKVPQTILSRCQRYDFKRIPLPLIVGRLREVVEYEGIEVESAVLELVARKATGALRDAVSLLDQLINEPGEVLTLDQARAILGVADEESRRLMIASILTADAAYGLNLINHISDQGTDPRQFALDMVEYLRLVMLAQTRGVEALSFEVGEDAIAPILEQANSYPRRALLDALTAFNEAAQDKSSGWQPQLPLEMAFLKSLESLHNPYEVPATAQAAPVERAAVKSSPAASAKAAPHIEESAVPLPAGDVPPLTRIIDQWEEVKRGVKQYNRPAEAVLRSGSIIGLEGNSILFQVQSDILRDKIQSPETRELIEHVLQHIFGVPLKFTCRVGDMSAGGTNQIQNLMAEDSLLSFGINDLGGTIKEIKEIEPDEEE